MLGYGGSHVPRAGTASCPPAIREPLVQVTRHTGLSAGVGTAPDSSQQQTKKPGGRKQGLV